MKIYKWNEREMRNSTLYRYLLNFHFQHRYSSRKNSSISKYNIFWRRIYIFTICQSQLLVAPPFVFKTLYFLIWRFKKNSFSPESYLVSAITTYRVRFLNKQRANLIETRIQRCAREEHRVIPNILKSCKYLISRVSLSRTRTRTEKENK